MAPIPSLSRIDQCDHRAPGHRLGNRLPTQNRVVIMMRVSILLAVVLPLECASAADLLGADISYGRDPDYGAIRDAEEQAYLAPLGRPIRWENPKTNHHGGVTPLEEIRQADGRKCRRLTVVVQESAGQLLSQAGGKACRATSGQWRVVEWQYTAE